MIDLLADEYRLLIGLILIASTAIGGLYYFLSWSNRVPVTGIDFDSGKMKRRKLRVNKDGSVTYRRVGGGGCRLVLDTRYGYSGDRSREYIADVSPGQGRILYIKRGGEVLRMPGDRLQELADAGVFREIGEGSKADLNALANKALIGLLIVGGVLLVAIGYLVYVVKGSGAV